MTASPFESDPFGQGLLFPEAAFAPPAPAQSFVELRPDEPIAESLTAIAIGVSKLRYARMPRSDKVRHLIDISQSLVDITLAAGYSEAATHQAKSVINKTAEFGFCLWQDRSSRAERTQLELQTARLARCAHDLPDLDRSRGNHYRTATVLAQMSGQKADRATALAHVDAYISKRRSYPARCFEQVDVDRLHASLYALAEMGDSQEVANRLLDAYIDEQWYRVLVAAEWDEARIASEMSSLDSRAEHLRIVVEHQEQQGSLTQFVSELAVVRRRPHLLPPLLVAAQARGFSLDLVAKGIETRRAQQGGAQAAHLFLSVLTNVHACSPNPLFSELAPAPQDAVA